MERKEIQDQRMRGYFLQATKEIIKGEGIVALNVRNVAERAGYSYATLYNYFKDLSMLIAEALSDFLRECIEFVKIEIEKAEPGEKRLIQGAKAYVKFFVQYPSIYQLTFIDRYNTITPRSSEMIAVGNITDDITAEDWDLWAKSHKVTDEHKIRVRENYNLLLNGLLLLYMNRRQPGTYSDMMDLLNKQLDFILN
jgi:AcrR family transcriptional regulator